MYSERILSVTPRTLENIASGMAYTSVGGRQSDASMRITAVIALSSRERLCAIVFALSAPSDDVTSMPW